MIVHLVAQRSTEWFALRVGRLTSSCAAEMQATLKNGKETAGRRNLRVRLALERLVGRSLERDFVSPAMQQGIEREADACALYEGLTGRLLTEVGFVAHDTLLAGCSPDGVVDDFEGRVECKCPIPATHLDYLRTGLIPNEYQKQILHQLWITGARWCDWLSYCPDFPEALQTKLVRFHRDEAQMQAYELIVRMFLTEVERELADIEALAGAVA